MAPDKRPARAMFRSPWVRKNRLWLREAERPHDHSAGGRRPPGAGQLRERRGELPRSRAIEIPLDHHLVRADQQTYAAATLER